MDNNNTITRNVAVTGKKVIRSKLNNTIPESITNNKLLNEAIKLLPKNYNFEIYKTIHRIQKDINIKTIALQFPEGLLMYSLVISDIIKTFCSNIVNIIILGDVTYGACCVDDYTAKKLGCDMLIHYGHSCLIPINITNMNNIIVMYIFVEIYFDEVHLIECLKSLATTHYATTDTNNTTNNTTATITATNTTDTPDAHNSNGSSKKRIALLGTVQFVSILFKVQEKLVAEGIYDR